MADDAEAKVKKVKKVKKIKKKEAVEEGFQSAEPEPVEHVDNSERLPAQVGYCVFVH